MAYRMAQQGVSNRDTNFNNLVVVPGAAKIRKPSWCKDLETNQTVVRFLPMVETDGSFTPYRLSTGNRDFGDWIRLYDVVRNWGTTGHTWILNDRTGRDDTRDNPAVLFYKAITAALKAGQDQQGWASLTLKTAASFPILSAPTEIYVARCAIFMINNKNLVDGGKSPLGLNDQDLPYFLEIPQSAGASLMRKLEERNENYQGTPDTDPDYFHNVYRCGDIVTLNKGAFIRIFRDGCDPQARQTAQVSNEPRRIQPGGARGIYNQQQNQQQKAENRYEVAIEPTWGGYLADIDDEQGITASLLRQTARPWEEFLNFPDNRTQAQYVNAAFGSEQRGATAILYAFRDHPDWIMDGTRAVAVQRTQAGPSGDTPPAAPAVVPGLKQAPVSPTAPIQGPTGAQGSAAGKQTTAGPTKATNWVNRPAAADPEAETAATQPSATPPAPTNVAGFDNPGAGQGMPATNEGMREMMAARARAAATAQATAEAGAKG